MKSFNRTFKDTEPVREAARRAPTFRFERHDVDHMWTLPSDTARKYWTPIVGPTTSALATVIGGVTREGPVTMTSQDLMQRLGVRKQDVVANAIRRAVVYMGAVPAFGAGETMTLSLPSGIYPPGADLRRKFSPELASEFTDYLAQVAVTLVEVRSESALTNPEQRVPVQTPPKNPDAAVTGAGASVV